MPILIQRIAALIVRRLQGDLTPAEESELQEWIQGSDENRELFARLTNDQTLQQELIEFYESKENVWNKIEAGISNTPVVPIQAKKRRNINILVAASIVLALSAGAFLWFQYSEKPIIAKTPAPNQQNIIKDVAPGGDRAVLTLSDGSIIYLDSVQNGILAKQGNINVIKTSKGEIKYSELGNRNLESVVAYNTVTTPKGGQYQIALPDGSKVWLNAASSIKYPTSFNSHERRVVITGEAYFEIAHINSPKETDSRQRVGDGGASAIPFIVKTIAPSGKETEVEVLGTHFNVNAYTDESSVNTTLLEGSVRISIAGQSSILKPGQQSQVGSENKIRVTNEVDLDDVVAWKNGMFQFTSVDIETIMRQVSRWYDIAVEYKGTIPAEKYRGGISRNVNLSQFLKILESSGVHYSIAPGDAYGKGRKLILMP